jgi:hypothetical protein
MTHHPSSVVRPDTLAMRLRPLLHDVGAYSRVLLPAYRLRDYQLAPARAIAESVMAGLGLQFAVVFSRQSGKDELLAQLIAWLLTRYQMMGGSIVVAAPTRTPQANITRDRVLDRLQRSALTAGQARTRDGYIIAVGQASARFLSADEGANPRGQTASLLLVANEAQDIDPAIWDARFDPMAASTNATTVFMGTVWDRNGLLHRQMEHLASLEGGAALQGGEGGSLRSRGEEGIGEGSSRRTPLPPQAAHGRPPQRSAPLEPKATPLVYRVPWPEVAAELPAYGDRVRARIAQFGESHPFIRTEYMLEPLDGEGGLFPPQRIAQLQGDHPRLHRAEPGKRYAGLLDVAGEEEEGSGPNAWDNSARRDSTALTIVEVDMQTASRQDGQTARKRETPIWSDAETQTGPDSLAVSPSSRLAVYRVVDRMAWTGAKHTALHDQLVDLARNVWRLSVMVVDATGVGAGLSSFLADQLGKGPRRVIVEPFVFTGKSKSDLGWAFVGLIDGGRIKEYIDDGTDITRIYRHQLAACTYEVLRGPGKLLRWSVPLSRGHDDLLISTALTARLDAIDWRERTARGSGGM